jgi:hypothetical protein
LINHKLKPYPELKAIWNESNKPQKQLKIPLRPTDSTIQNIVTSSKREASAQLNDFLDENKILPDPGGVIFDKISSSTTGKGVEVSRIKDRPEMLNTTKEGFFTDSYVLIIDKNISDKLGAEIRTKLKLPNEIEGAAPKLESVKSDIIPKYSKKETVITGV